MGVLDDNAALARQVTEVQSLDPLTASRDNWVAHIRERAASSVVLDRTGAIVMDSLDRIASAVATSLREHADDLLDQLRARFDQAAATVTAATRVGILAGSTADDVLDLGAKAITAWRALPDAAAVLDEIAAVRIALTSVLDVAPLDGTFEPRRYGAAFNSCADWETRDRSAYGVGPRGVNRWLRLAAAQPEPLRLLTIAATHELDLATREDITETAV